MAENIATIEIVESMEIANVHAVFAHVTEKMVGYEKRLGEYPPSPPCQLKFSISTEKTKVVSNLADLICSANVSLFSPFPSNPRIFRAKFELNGTAGHVPQIGAACAVAQC